MRLQIQRRGGGSVPAPGLYQARGPLHAAALTKGGGGSSAFAAGHDLSAWCAELIFSEPFLGTNSAKIGSEDGSSPTDIEARKASSSSAVWLTRAARREWWDPASSPGGELLTEL
mmetsp:Transcript_5996/g.16453  ORF Transcript_5996/g.16453 Transcript_5996/m.16453 type:complete len:115 (-) Transcript_5996:1217-1561(-)